MTYHIHTQSNEAAWSIADSLVSCDYLPAVTSAPYPVYECTDGSAWISDLGTSLEINLANGDTHKVWIDEIWE